MYTAVRIFWFFVIVIFSFQVGDSSANEKKAPLEENFLRVEFKNGLLKVSVDNQPFKKVLGEVAEKTGIAIVMKAPVNKNLTINFDYLPLEKAFRQILRGSNCVFIYRSERTQDQAPLLQVLIFPKPSEQNKTVLGGSAQEIYSYQAKQTMTMEEMTHLEQKMLEKVLRNLPPEEEAFKIAFYEKLKKMHGEEEFKEMVHRLEKFLESSPEEEMNFPQEVKEALEWLNEREQWRKQ
jgi:hypothetical protein